MSAEENKGRKSQAALEFIMTYGWVILVVLAAVGAFAYSGFLSPCNFYPEYSEYFKQNCPTTNPIPVVTDTQEDISIDWKPDLQDICNELVVNNEVYPFLEVMGKGLRKANNAQFVAYKFPAELRSDLDIFNVDGLILCGVPAELCYTENNDIKGGSYCVNWVLEVPVTYQNYVEWYQKVSGEIENAKD